jgi:hypothetical protein
VSISYHAGEGASADSAGTQTTTQTLTLPSGLSVGDVLLITVSLATLTSSASTLSASSTATTPTQLGSTQSTTSSSVTNNGALYWMVVGSSDPGATITFASSAAGFWVIDMQPWTGADTTGPPSVFGATTTHSTVSITCPAESTPVAGCWAVYLASGVVESGTMTGPSGATQRGLHFSAADVGAAIFDSNGSVGGSSTSIGGGIFDSSGSTSTWWAAWTVALAPAVTGVTGTGAVTSPKPSLSGLGYVPGTATGGVTAPKPSLSGTGTVPATGTGSVRSPKPSLAGSGFIPITGAGGVTAPKPSLAGTGTDTPPSLVIAITPEAGVDDFGNAYPAGVTAFFAVTGAGVAGTYAVSLCDLAGPYADLAALTFANQTSPSDMPPAVTAGASASGAALELQSGLGPSSGTATRITLFDSAAGATTGGLISVVAGLVLITGKLSVTSTINGVPLALATAPTNGAPASGAPATPQSTANLYTWANAITNTLNLLVTAVNAIITAGAASGIWP